MKVAHCIAFILLIIGGLNWLVVGIWGVDVGTLFGGQTVAVSRVIYVLVGISALWEIFTHKRNCKNCVKTESAPMA